MPRGRSRSGPPGIDGALLRVGNTGGVYADISGVAARPWQLYNALLTATSMGVMDKLLFGSGFPNDLPASAIESMYSVNAYSHGTQLPTIPRSSLRAIVEKDSLACLGINTEVPASPVTHEEPDEVETPVIEVVRATEPIQGTEAGLGPEMF